MISKLGLTAAAGVLLSTSSFAQAASYSLVKDYSGQSFFDHWDYYGSFDNLTNGDVVYVNQTVGTSAQLTYINSAGNAIIKVDNTTTVPYNEKRNTVRLTSKDKISLGTFVTWDTLHVPYGCSVWPSFWTKAVGNNWPAGGEIDVFEAVNNQQTNQMALHTRAGCSQAAGVTQTGTTSGTSPRPCDNNSTTGAGCTVTDPSQDSYGAPLGAAGGGVWAMEFSETNGVNIWFFSRPNVPASLTASSPGAIDPSTLGNPTGSWPASSCTPSQFFEQQELVITLTLCGDWAGLPNILSTTGCPALQTNATCYSTYVLDPKNYDNAFFEIKSIRIWATDPANVATASSASSTPTTTTGSGHSAAGKNAVVVSSLIAAVGMVGALALGL